MIVKGILFEDFVNYKKAAMYIAFPKCDFKCDKENGIQLCRPRLSKGETKLRA